jgi:hypothetical protein
VLKGQFQDKTPSDAKLGTNTKCKKCTKRKQGEWTVFPCNSLHTSDAVHQRCSTCQPGEYEFAKCTKSSDTICPACPSAKETLYKNDKNFKSGLQYCALDKATKLPKTRCSVSKVNGKVVPQQTKCGYWLPEEGMELPKNTNKCRLASAGGKCGQWKSGCKEGFFGQSCCYHKYPYGCGVATTRERTGKRAGYVKGKGKFHNFCVDLCEEFPDCLAVEVQDNGTFKEPAGEVDESDDNKKCLFKAAYTQNQKYKYVAAYIGDDGKKKGGDPELDCYSNTCRMNSYSMGADGKPTRTLNYKA